jgi:hypothetical protein
LQLEEAPDQKRFNIDKILAVLDFSMKSIVLRGNREQGTGKVYKQRIIPDSSNAKI